MKVIIGLGNPGEKYQNTRHNLGFLALDTLLEKFEPVDKTFWETKTNLKADIKQIRHKDETLLLVKPTTFMNNSGFAVSKVLNFYKIEPENLTVVHDDLDLPFGKIRVRFGGGAGGHHGVESIIDQLKDDKFLRIRLGIGNPKKIQNSKFKIQNYDASEYVLAPLSSADKGKVKTMLKETVKIVELTLIHGIDTYMSKYNK